MPNKNQGETARPNEARMEAAAAHESGSANIAYAGSATLK
jgi:hypothetical protein